MKQTASAFEDSMPKHIWSKFKSILPRRSRDTISPPAIVESSGDQRMEDETASVEPSTRVFYADGPCAGLDVTTVAFSRDLSKSGVTSHPVFVVRNLDITPEDEDSSLRLSVNPHSTGSSHGVGSTYAPPSQDFSEPRIKLSSMLRHNGQGSERSKASGITNCQDSGSRQSVDYSIGAPQRKGTPPLLFGTQQMKSFDSNSGGLVNTETTAPFNSSSTTQATPIAIRLPRFDTQLMDMEVRLLKKQLSKINTDGVHPSILHAKRDKVLFEALCDRMPVAIHEPRLNLIDDLLFPVRPKPVAIIPKRLPVPEKFSATDCWNSARAKICQ